MRVQQTISKPNSSDSPTVIRTSSPTENSSSSPEPESTSKPDKFFSKIDSRVQESFFWLAAKQPLSTIDDEAAGPPDVIVSSPNGYAPLPSDVPPKRSVNGATHANNDSMCSKLTVFLSVLVFLMLFILLPILYYFHFIHEHPDHRSEANIAMNESVSKE